MPRRTKLTGAITPEDGNEQHAAPAQGIDPDDLSDDVQFVLAQLGEAASMCVVYRMDPTKVGKWDYIARVPASEFNHEYLKEQFGGGEYKIVIIDAKQGPLNAVFTSIDSRFTGKMFASAPAPVAGGGDAFKDRLLEVLLMKALAPAPAPVVQDPNQSLDMALKIAALFKDNGGGNVGEQLKTTVELATLLADRSNPPEGLAGVAAQFLPVLDRLTHATPAAPASVVRRAIPATSTVTPVTTPPTTAPLTPNPPARVAGSIIPAWLSPFKSVAPMLVTFADNGASAVMYADVALDQLSNNEAWFTAAVESMNAGRMLADLYALSPALQETDKRKAFAAELVAAVEEGLRQMIADDTGSAAHGG